MKVKGGRAVEQEEFIEAVRAYSGAMFRAARGVLDTDADAEDAVGEALLRAWRSRESLREPKAVRGWLVRITVNCACQQRRRVDRTTPVEDLEALAGTVEDRPYEDLWAAVTALPPVLRGVVVLFYYEDMTIPQIARALGAPEGTVKSRLSRARESLKRMLTEEGTP